jgi:hypothetical protein
MGHFAGFHYAQDNLGVKKVSAPSKNPKKCPILCFAPEKKIIFCTFRTEVHWYFYVLKRERTREGGRERARERKGKGKRERHRQKCGQLYF